MVQVSMVLSIITINYKKPELTKKCLAALHVQFDKELKEHQLEVIIVDNHSGDDSVNVLRSFIKEKQYPNMHVKANASNTGFSGGCNAGAALAKGKYLLFLNNDTLVQDKSILDMVQYLDKHQNVAILGGKLINPDGTDQPSVGKFYTSAQVVALLTGLQRFGWIDKNPQEVAPVDWVKGALLMIRAEIFNKLHGFDERIFMYAEDMELCYRAKLAGYPTYFYPFTNVTHAEHGSGDRSFAIVQIYQSLLYFYKKHRSYGEYLFVKSLLKTKAVLLIVAGHVLQRPYLIKTYEKAIKVA